jgi:hypothetical protein
VRVGLVQAEIASMRDDADAVSGRYPRKEYVLVVSSGPRLTPSTLNSPPGIVALLLFSLLGLAPVPAASQELPIPRLALWEAHMLSFGQTHCDYLAQPHTPGELLDHVYYDAERVFYQIADYTGDSAWTTCAQRAEASYRDQYVIPNDGNVPGYWNFTTGLRMDAERTGDARSKNAAILLSQRVYARDRVPLAWTVTADRSREVAYAILSYIDAQALGEPLRQRRIDLVNQAYGHMDEWFVDFSWPGPWPWQLSSLTTTRLAPFMVGITAHALIRDWEETRDPRLIPALRRAADWMWTNAWIPSVQAMWYEFPSQGLQCCQASGAAPDLNLLIAPLYAFLYRQTGDIRYRDQGDQLFAGGVTGAYLNPGKQFNQNYWWSFDYVTWRMSPADETPPTVTITAPLGGASVAGTLAIAVSATDNVGVAGVQFRVDGANLGAEVTVVPYAVSWDTTAALNGTHVLIAVARDAAGNTATADPVTVTVNNPDLTPPTVALTAPGTGAVAGMVTVTASATDDVGVVGVQVKLDGVALGAEMTAAPYAVTWDTKTAPNGAHTLTAVARDAAGNVGTSAALSVTVANDMTAPNVALTAPAAGAVAGTVTVSASATDDVGVVGVQVKLDGAALGAEMTAAPYAVAWDTKAVANGAHTLTAVARDAAGNVSTSAAVSVTVANDLTAPTVALAAPAAGTVAGAVTVSASATDDVGVVGMQIKLDEANLGAEMTVAPYAVTWDTKAVANGAHTLTAVARDAAGNVGTSAAVSVTVANDMTAPTVALTAPAAGMVAGAVTVSASATDDVGVVGVQVKLDGVALGAEMTAAPYAVAWDTKAVANGAHMLTAVARDAAGNVGTSAAVSVTVANDLTAPTVALTAPAAGTVAGAVTVSASATDDVGVVGVQVKLDGIALGAEMTAAPYAVVWDTRAVGNGAYTLTAVARDAAGNATTSAAVTVTVSNDGGN